MLQLNLKQLITSRGINNPGKYLVKAGFTYYAASRLLNNKVDSISYRHAEQLCLLLNCSLDELFIWKQPPNTQISKDHPLQKLKPKQTGKLISEHLKELPLQKLEEVKNYIEQIRKDQI